MYATGGFIPNTGSGIPALVGECGHFTRSLIPMVKSLRRRWGGLPAPEVGPFLPEHQQDPPRKADDEQGRWGDNSGCAFDDFRRSQEMMPPWLRSDVAMLVCNCEKCQRMRPVC